METDKMERPEIISLLRRAHDELITLRRQVAALEPKAHAYDTIAQLARLSHHPESQGYSEDVAWRLKQAVDTLVAERAAEREESNDGR
jgi:hypothetical protein